MRYLYSNTAWIILVTFVLAPSVVVAQFGLPDPGDLIPDAGDLVSDLGDIDLEDLIADLIVSSVGVDDGPRLTSTLDDAVTDIPFLDDFNPNNFQSMLRLRRRSDGSFIYRAGRWQLDVRSYCLNAAMYGPGTGDGYLYVPLTGPYSGQIQSILSNSALHPEIPQSDIQCLLWGILARTRIRDMSPDLQNAAKLLLSDDEVSAINGDALGLVPIEYWDQVFESLDVSPSVRRVLEAQAGIRTELSSNDYTFEEIESIAMLDGEAPPEDAERYVPEGRWSYHPGGYFIRYFPHGYIRITKEVSVPYSMLVMLDDLGRVTSISDMMGRSLEIEYDDSVSPLAIPGTSLSIYAFESIRCGDQVWSNEGSTIAGFASPDAIPKISGSGRFSSAGAMTEWAGDHLEEIKGLCGDRIGWPRVLRLGLLTQGIQSVAGTPDDPVVEFCMEAWQHALLRVMESEHQTADTRIIGSKPHEDHGFLIATKARTTTATSLKSGGGGDGDGGDDGGSDGGGAAPGKSSAQIVGTSDMSFEPIDISPDSEPFDEDVDPLNEEEAEEISEWLRGYDLGYIDGWHDWYHCEEGRRWLPDAPDEAFESEEPFWQGYRAGYQVGKSEASNELEFAPLIP